MKVNAVCHIRWMVRRDMQEVLAIESESFPVPWTEDDFIRCLRQRTAIGMVAEIDGRIVGYMVYDLGTTLIYVHNFAVATEFRRQGVGSQMVDRLKAKLSPCRHRWLAVDVAESNLGGHLFFKACGLEAMKIERERYEDGQDAYRFAYRVRRRAMEAEQNQKCEGR